jgi:hypothetical protein
LEQGPQSHDHARTDDVRFERGIPERRPFAPVILRENVLTFSVTEEGSVVARDQRQGKIAPVLEWTKSSG